MKNEKIVVISLGNTSACILYGINVAKSINNISNNIHFVGSKNTIYLPQILRLQCKKTLVNTYKNHFQFVVNTLFILPFLAVRLFLIKNAVYLFPQHHFWNVFIIIALRLKKAKIFFAVHDDKMHSGMENKFEAWSTDYQFKKSSYHIYMTKYVEDQVKKRLNLNQKSKVIPLGLFEYPEMHTCERDISNKPVINILLFGYIAQYKGVYLMVDAFEKLREEKSNVILSIVGKHAHEKMFDNERIDKLDIRVINKFVENDNLHHYFNNTDIVVLPYLEASQSGVLSIAQYCCIPSIVTNVGGLPEMVDNYKTGIIVQPNVDEIYLALKYLIENTADYKRISSGIAQYKNQISWEKIGESWLSFIRQEERK